jgi:hypothetical protein
MSTTHTITLDLVGNTYPQRKILREHGWRWSADGKCWTLNVQLTSDAAHALERERVGDCTDNDPRFVFARSIHANQPGCALYIGRALVWASKTHGARAVYVGNAAAIAEAAQRLHDL